MPTPAAQPVLLAWSGGKDSSLALARLQADPGVRVCALVTAVTMDYDRISIHGVRRELLELQAAAIGLPLIIAPLAAGAPNAAYEEAWAGALAEGARRFDGATHVAYGDLFLEDVRAYREAQLRPLGYTPLYPIWREDTTRLAQRFISEGFRAVLTCVDTTQLDGKFAGREFNEELLSELPPRVDPCGERGEFHTFVWAGPHMRHAVSVVAGERVLRDQRFEYCDFLAK
ncbi:MAG: ATP-binding protein [Gemmatimonadaceae bacterium]